jgi:hypothetical protein
MGDITSFLALQMLWLLSTIGRFFSKRLVTLVLVFYSQNLWNRIWPVFGTDKFFWRKYKKKSV